jgi:hypothetical protein
MTERAETINQIMLLYRQRTQILQAEIRLGNQLKALERWQTGKLVGKRKEVMTEEQIEFARLVVADVNPILEPAEKAWRKDRKRLERDMEKLVKEFPVWSWVESVRGIGPLGLACIIGACGDLSKYSGPSKMWKRMGLAVIDGERQRRIAGTNAEKTALAILHGFSPTRRALAFVLSECLLKQNKGEYRQLYDERKEYELERLPEDAKGRKAWAHRRALRYMIRRFLLHLWCTWNGKPLSLAQQQAEHQCVASHAGAAPPPPMV